MISLGRRLFLTAALWVPIVISGLTVALYRTVFHEIHYQEGTPCPLTTTTKANSPHFAS